MLANAKYVLDQIKINITLLIKRYIHLHTFLAGGPLAGPLIDGVAAKSPVIEH